MRRWQARQLVDLIWLVAGDAVSAWTQWLPVRCGRLRADEEHLQAVIAWLKRSHDVTGRQGSSAGYSLLGRWRPAYPETTGYLIPTFLNYGTGYDDEDAVHRAVEMAEWELKLQYDSGGIPGRHVGVQNAPPVVFNTGQVIFGLLAVYRQTGNEEFLTAACRAGDFLLSCQDEGGCFVRHTYYGIPHTYNTRTAWSLLCLHQTSQDTRYLEAACRNLEWAVAQQEPNGWLRHNQFSLDRPVNTHGLAYAAEGFIEAYTHVEDSRYLKAGSRIALQLLHLFEIRGNLPGEFSEDWSPLASYSCVAGNIQFAKVWMRLYQMLGELRYLIAALRMITWAMRLQRVRGASPGVRGGVKGSHPIYGRYARLQFPNWAAKFFADALMLKLELWPHVQANLSLTDKILTWQQWVPLSHEHSIRPSPTTFLPTSEKTLFQG
jgi:hypothetical protein